MPSFEEQRLLKNGRRTMLKFLRSLITNWQRYNMRGVCRICGETSDGDHDECRLHMSAI
jgi:hypothetical protein